ncbi:MAG: MFS transporter [Acidimicrobiales bacterium]|jgi:dTMP kinase|nr:MFS transporter [Acidimicrobiales bacterium]
MGPAEAAAAAAAEVAAGLPSGHPVEDPALDDTGTTFPPTSTDRPGWHVRLFGSAEFFRLWIVQVVSATGDWLAFSAILLLVTDIYEGNASASAGAISLVISVRLIPGFFFAPVAGVLVDRFDRKKVMVTCDLGRAAVVAVLPFVRNLLGLVLLSLLLEVLTLLWSPAKEASVPNLVPQDHLTTANSLSLAAAYGTWPVAQLLFAALAGLSAWLGGFDVLSFFGTSQMALAFYVDALTFLLAAYLVWGLPIGRARHRGERGGRRVDMGQTFHELKEGWHYIFINPTVRAVNLGLATGLVGGGMLIPLGAVFSTEVLGEGATGYGLFTTALGFGVALGVVGVSALQKKLPATEVFTASLFVAGTALVLGASFGRLAFSAVCVFVMGVSVGPIYVLGFSILQSEVDDELRGRVFAALNTLVRFCVLVSLTLGPLLAAFLGSISDSLVGGEIGVGTFVIEVPGVRLTLWTAGIIIIMAGVMARHSIRAGLRDLDRTVAQHPTNRALGEADGPNAPSTS